MTPEFSVQLAIKVMAFGRHKSGYCDTTTRTERERGSITPHSIAFMLAPTRLTLSEHILEAENYTNFYRSQPSSHELDLYARSPVSE